VVRGISRARLRRERSCSAFKHEHKVSAVTRNAAAPHAHKAGPNVRPSCSGPRAPSPALAPPLPARNGRPQTARVAEEVKSGRLLPPLVAAPQTAHTASRPCRDAPHRQGSWGPSALCASLSPAACRSRTDATTGVQDNLRIRPHSQAMCGYFEILYCEDANRRPRPNQAESFSSDFPISASNRARPNAESVTVA